ncbi:unnamed protein product [Cylicocyclus nassatus]|uniref:Uncharacterized protein n=1 Tax=Cylicocyclus nassatus TaxID=53992 RepID=A0AA36H447_CYLNA|nr:unnamed protein product [Cylicocyclus nassatus]
MTYSWPVVLFVVNTVLTRVAADVCLSRHFYDIQGKDVDDYIIYGLTQDCQIFFIRPSQIALLSTINVNIHNSYCYPNLVQLHLKSHNSLLLVTKQAGNRICTLDVQIPPTEMLFGDHLFSYSLLSSLPYASCSHSPPQMFRLEPDLSFLDTVFNDVIYFIDAHSTGALWTVHQFQINNEGFLKHLEKISINNHAKPLEVWTGPDLASEYVVALDNQRNYIFVRNRFERSMLFECAYDLLFRPNTLVTHHLNTTHEGRPWLNSMGADLNLLLYTETDRSVEPFVTRLFAANTALNRPGTCLVYTNYAFDIGIVRQSTLKKMEANPLPSFEKSRRMGTSRTTSKHKIKPASKLRTTTPIVNLRAHLTYQVTRPSTPLARHRLTTTTPKITTIYLSSTEKIITSTEFRQDLEDEEYEDEGEELVESTTTRLRPASTSTRYSKEERDQNRIMPPQLEKSKILERDNEKVGLMTTPGEDALFQSDNASLASNMTNSDLLTNTVYRWRILSLLYCLFLFVLE